MRLTILALCFWLVPLSAGEFPWLSEAVSRRLEDVPTPASFSRQTYPESSFEAWISRLPLQPGRGQVHLFDGRLKGNQEAQHAILAVDVGNRDLQQCADAVMRLRAEYLFAQKRDVHFKFTSGDEARWSEWAAGKRPVFKGNKVQWQNTGKQDASYANFRRYLNMVFAYAGTASLAKELVAVKDPNEIRPGDIFIHGGFPGHAVIVAEVVQNSSGQKRFSLLQSYMPAQEIQLLRVPGQDQPWYEVRSQGSLETPEWVFQFSELKRFGSP